MPRRQLSAMLLKPVIPYLEIPSGCKTLEDAPLKGNTTVIPRVFFQGKKTIVGIKTMAKKAKGRYWLAGLAHLNCIMEHRHEIPKSWKKMRIVFAGTVASTPAASADIVPILQWGGDNWSAWWCDLSDVNPNTIYRIATCDFPAPPGTPERVCFL